MKIRHLVCTDNFAGVERYVASTGVELARRGHDVEILGGNPAAMRPLVEPAGVRHIGVATTRGVARANLAKPRPDVIHAHMTAADIAAVATRPLVRRPIVSTLHFAQPRGHSPLTRWVYATIPRLVTAQIAISQTVADANPGQIDVLHNGVPAPVGDHIDTPREPIVLVAQRLESEKDTVTALEAFARSGLGAHGWSLHICGEGSELAALQARSTRLGIADATAFFGRVDDIDTRMRTASLFVATATCEPFGLAVVEAMANGLAVVATDGGAHRETIGPAGPGTLFAPGDAAAAGEILARLAADPAERAELGTRARARWHEAFTVQTHVDALEALYRRVLHSRS